MNETQVVLAEIRPGPGAVDAADAAPRLPGRIPSLDGLRAASIGLVLLGHAAGTRNAPGFLDHAQHLGNLGVKVFFVISGFLITTLLLKELDATNRISLKGFYLRRTCRIFPAFYVYVGVVAVLWAFGYVRLENADLLRAVTYTMNYAGSLVYRSWSVNHLWSLAVEEQFYLIWPALLWWIGRRRGMAAAALAVALAPLIRAVMWYQLGLGPTAVTRQFQAVSDSLASGCLLSGCFNWLGASAWYLKAVSSRLFLAVPCAGMALAMATFGLGQGAFYIAGQSIANLSIALAVDHLVRFPDSPVGRLLNSRLFVFVGVLSYSLYLWQELFLNPSDWQSSFTAFPGNLVLALLAALASYYLVEKPFLRLKTRIA